MNGFFVALFVILSFIVNSHKQTKKKGHTNIGTLMHVCVCVCVRMSFANKINVVSTNFMVYFHAFVFLLFHFVSIFIVIVVVHIHKIGWAGG